MIYKYVAGAVLAAVLGFWGSSYMLGRKKEARKQEAHAELASIRTYEEAYALRHGHYRLLPDSCRHPGDGAWKDLGRPAPAPTKGCFRVESPDPAFTAAPTAPTMQIVAELADLGIQGVEGNDDSRPKWEIRSASPPLAR